MGRGGSSLGGGSLGGGGGAPASVTETTDIWSYRHNKNNAPFVDAINSGLRSMDNDFPGFASGINTVDAVKMSGADNDSTLGFWSPATKQLAMNVNYTDVNKMNNVMDSAKQSGLHPSRGNKTGTEAVALHEAGHALTDKLAADNGFASLHAFSADVVKKAYKQSGMKGGNRGFAGTISKYATKNYAECVAEAVTDWYCNGNKAANASKLIMAEIKKYK